MDKPDIECEDHVSAGRTGTAAPISDGTAREPVNPRTAGISRRAVLKALGAALAAAALPACGPAPEGPSSHANQPAQLVFQDCRCLGEQHMLAEFQAAHPDIEVFYISDPDNYEEKMLADMQAGIAPDVLAGCCDTLPIWAEMDYLLDLRPYVDADLDPDTISDWDPIQYDSFRLRNGARFALPKYHGALALYFNKDLFGDHNVAYPDSSWTHDEYLDAMKRLTLDQNGDSAVDVWGSMLDVSWERIQVHVNGWGGHFVDPQDDAKCWMAKPEALSAMEWLRARMWDDRVMATELDVQNLETRDAFVEGRLAMVEEGSWALRDILEGADFRIGVAPFPAGPERHVTLATTDGFAIYSGTRHPDAAWELMKFLIGRDYGRAMAKSQLLQPARASLLDEWIDLVREQYPEQSQEIDLGAFAEGHIMGYSVSAEIFANMADARRLALESWEQIYGLGQARVDVMKKTAAMIDRAQLGSS